MGWRRQKGLTFSVDLKFRLLMLSPNQGYMIAIKRGVKKIFFKKALNIRNTAQGLPWWSTG